jgi:flagellar biosynthesis/type III secretory pathway protein FliH
MATQQKKTGRDYPLSPTPEPMRTDNTAVSKVKPNVKELYPNNPDYSYKSTNYNSKDSSDYKAGYKYGIKEVSSNPDAKNRMRSEKYEKGKTAIGLNDRYNEGFSEGKDKVLDKKSKKK